MVAYIFNDGGRAEAGFKGKTGDCVTRAVAIATGKPYKEVYEFLAENNAKQRITKRSPKTSAGVKTARNGINTKRKWFKDWMVGQGYKWVAVASIGTTGILPRDVKHKHCIAKQRRHYVAILDGVVHDTWNSSERLVYGYWYK